MSSGPGEAFAEMIASRSEQSSGAQASGAGSSKRVTAIEEAWAPWTVSKANDREASAQKRALKELDCLRLICLDFTLREYSLALMPC